MADGGPDEIPMRRIIVAGASLAGHQAARSLRKLGFDGRLTILGAETHLPYERYPLSKDYLTRRVERDRLDIDSRDLDVEWQLGRTATGLDLDRRCVVVDRVERAHFDGLVVATGSRPRLPFPLAEGVSGAFVLRTIEDGEALRAALGGPPHRLVIVGDGLIAAEVASAATALGHSTAMVGSSPVPTSRALGLDVARHLCAVHADMGVTVVPDTRVSALVVRAGRVRGVRLCDGGKLHADLVVLASGTRPNVEWLRTSGLEVSGGLGCRDTLHAIGSDIVVGAGDVVRAPHRWLEGDSVRLEHWTSTRYQARLAAANLLQGPELARPQDELPTFVTSIHGVRIRVLGFPAQAEVGWVAWGSLRDNEALVTMYRRGRLVAAAAVNAADKLNHLRDSWASHRMSAPW